MTMMRTRKRFIGIMALGVGLLWQVSPAAAQKEERFATRLAPVPIDAAMKANVTGVGTATAVLTGMKLTVTGTFEGLKTAATIAQIRRGPNTGVRGPSILDLTVSKDVNGKVSGTFDLTEEQADSLRKGKLYIQIHSEKAPDGNLWGWLLRQEAK